MFQNLTFLVFFFCFELDSLLVLICLITLTTGGCGQYAFYCMHRICKMQNTDYGYYGHMQGYLFIFTSLHCALLQCKMHNKNCKAITRHLGLRYEAYKTEKLVMADLGKISLTSNLFKDQISVKIQLNICPPSWTGI